MTRSFGDVMASKVGVISEPEVIEYEVKKGNNSSNLREQIHGGRI